MDDSRTLRDSHPQKYYLKKLCTAMYYMGLGDCWYEKTERSITHKFFYAIWAVTINGYLILNTLNQVLANLRSDLTGKEQSDMLQFAFAHPCLCAKFIFLIFQKKRIRVLFERLLEGSRSVYISPKVDKESVRKVLFYSAILVTVAYGTLFLGTVDAIKTYIKEGGPFQAEVVLYPTRNQSGFFINVFRVFIELHWWCIVTNMILIDVLSFFAMVYIRYKFTIVSLYFKDLKTKIQGKIQDVNTEISKEIEKDFIIGIKLHEDSLWCAKNVQYALGNIYSVHVFEFITLLVMCLVKLTTIDRDMMFMIATLQYMLCLLVLIGAYFTAAGDVTYEAAEVGTAIFQCGWEMVPMGTGLRSLAVVAIQRSQMPVFMTAFGVVMLSHENLISVLRASYSFFAVTY